MFEGFAALIGFVSFAAAIGLGITLVLNLDKVRSLQAAVENLRRALDEMDEQAKLVVRTDIELNKAQEELDKKLTGLYTLQKLSRAISSTFEEDQIFQKIDVSYLRDLGFEKAAAFLFNEPASAFRPCLQLGYAADEPQIMLSCFETLSGPLRQFINLEKTASSIRLAESPIPPDKAHQALKSRSFVIAPILPKEGSKGFLFVGTSRPDTVITEGDEELITLLAHQLGQALENARLFEKTWQAHQNLEKRVEERTRQLSQALEEVKRISQRKNDFVSNVSHELRTPLTSIKGYASILLSGKLGALPEDVQKRLEKINKHSDELVQFVNDLLDISRIESGRMTLKLAPLNIKGVVEEIADLLAIQLKEKQIAFSTDIKTDIPEAIADYGQIKRVFINLISNAIKYTPQGKIFVNASYGKDRMVHVEIKDTGCGIPAEALDKLFTEFYRVDTPMNQEIKGTGLGLALVKHIVEAHRGTITVSSTVGSGTSFNFTLPTEL